MKKKLIPLLSALLTVMLLATLALFSGAQSTEPKLSIAYCNLEFGQDTHILYAVTSDGIENVDDIKLLIWKTPQTDYTGTPDYTLGKAGNEMIGNDDCIVFEFADLAAKNMTDNVYARAHIKIDGKDYYSPVNKYSVLQYAYNMLGKTKDATDDEDLKTLLADMLTYGASAQKYAKHNTARLTTADWYQVKLTAGVLDDGCNHGLYLTGDKVKITAPATDKDGNAFKCWTNKAGTSVSTSASCELTVGNQNEVYTPTYSTAPATKTYTVKFVDHDGTTLKTETVESGKSATAPSDPTRDGHTFTGWDKKFDNVTADMTVTALYEEISTDFTVKVNSTTAKVGDETVTVVISVANNPGIAALKFDVGYGVGLTLDKVTFGSAFTTSGMQTDANPKKGAINTQMLTFISWDENNTANGTFATLTFSIDDTATTGTPINIKLVPYPDDIFDSDFNEIEGYTFVDGIVTLEN